MENMQNVVYERTVTAARYYRCAGEARQNQPSSCLPSPYYYLLENLQCFGSGYNWQEGPFINYSACFLFFLSDTCASAYQIVQRNWPELEWLHWPIRSIGRSWQWEWMEACTSFTPTLAWKWSLQLGCLSATVSTSRWFSPRTAVGEEQPLQWPLKHQGFNSWCEF